MAHEIKNPLVSIASGVELLEAKAEADSHARSILRLVRVQVRRIEAAIGDLLSYARPRKPRVIWADPVQIIDRSIALIQPQAEAAEIKIEKQAGDVPKFQVDPELVTQALVNLAMNGIQAMREGGVLTIATKSQDDEVHISITDSGKGIREDQIEKIFRPFYTTKHRGSGLGLAITRGIVERHGGRIEVESVIAKGSCFTLVVPVREQRAA
jgi:two-component system sensor histidine kinase HydH